MRRYRYYLLAVLVVLVMLVAPVLAQELNSYLSVGGVHWIWCGDAADGTDGDLVVYRIADWAVKVECVERHPPAPAMTHDYYFPIVYKGGDNG